MSGEAPSGTVFEHDGGNLSPLDRASTARRLGEGR